MGQDEDMEDIPDDDAGSRHSENLEKTTVKSAQKPKTGGIKEQQEKEEQSGPNLRNYKFDSNNFAKEADPIVSFSKEALGVTLKSGFKI